MPICKYYVVYIINYNTEYGLISVNKYISNKIWQREDTLDPETANILFIYVFFFFFSGYILYVHLSIQNQHFLLTSH